MGKKSTRKNRSQKIFIEPLEQRIMLDGAGASTFLDLIDERSQGDNSNKTTYDVKKFKEIKSEDGSKELPFTNIPRDQLKRKQIVFIDKQVSDYEKLAMNFISLIKSLFIIILLSIFSFGSANAKCNFIMDLGKKYTKSHEKKYGPLKETAGYYEFDILASDICLSDNFDYKFIVRHIFLEKKLMAIKFFANNFVDNSATESMKLMNYAKRIYGNFDTGGNPKNYNNYHIWEKDKKFIIYNRQLNKDVWQEEIYISNNKNSEKLAEWNNLIESRMFPVEN